MVDQPTSASFRVAVKTEPVDSHTSSTALLSAAESIAEPNYCAPSTTNLVANNVAIDPNYSNYSSGISYFPLYSVYGNYNPSVTAFSTVPIESQEPSVPHANLSNLSAKVPQNPAPSTCDNYEFPRYYFEALIDDAQIRYDIASEFFQNMRTYSSKCDVYISILHDLFVELAKPPPTLEQELYRRLAKLRRCIRHLELKMASRRPRIPHKDSSPSLDRTPERLDYSEKATQFPEAANDGTDFDFKSSVQELEIDDQEECSVGGLKTKEKLKLKMYNLARKERELREERHNVEAELRSQFRCSGGRSSEVPPASSSRFMPSYNCVFCGKHNMSYTCWIVPTLEERRMFFRKHKICYYCGKSHAGECQIADAVVCAWPQCGARGRHNSALCPYADYPITISQVLAIRAVQKSTGAKSQWPSECIEKETPVSKRLSTSQSSLADSSKRLKKLVTGTVLEDDPPSKLQC